MVRCRMAPAPTGRLHVGTAHTALFNWLFARHSKGTFILRIDDSDPVRSKKEFEQDIIDGLAWMGIDWDEGPYHQSDKGDVYAKYIKKLMDSGHAYKCFCTSEELEKERESQRAEKTVPKYSGKCRTLTPEEIAVKESQGQKGAIRFIAPNKIVKFTDMVRGEIEVDMGQFGDFLIARSDGSPLLNLAVVVDDIELKITHIIRGEDFLNATPFQILIYEALNEQPAQIANISFIYAPDHTKLSKRHGATSVLEYKEKGYLKEAMVNFLALLGWNPGDDREIFSLQDLVKEFTIERVQKSAPTFNIEKLNWFNQYYIRGKSNEELLELIKPFSKHTESDELLLKIIPLVKDRLVTLADFPSLTEFFFVAPSAVSDPAINPDHIRFAVEQFDNLIKPDFVESVKAKGYKVGDFFMSLRIAITGQRQTPPITETMLVLGKEESLSRLSLALKNLSS